MESQNKEKEYEHSIWEIYRREWATVSPEKKTELNKQMLRWQELMKNGWTAQQAYYKAMEDELDFTVAEEPSDKSPLYSLWSSIPKVRPVILVLAVIAVIVYSIVTNTVPELPVGMVLMVLGGLIMYLGCFPEGFKQGLRKLSKQNGGSGGGDWLPFTFVVSWMLIVAGAALIYRAIAIL